MITPDIVLAGAVFVTSLAMGISLIIIALATEPEKSSDAYLPVAKTH
jgi:hypothetical protein